MIQNGTPMGPGFFIFFNNLDTAPPQGFKGFRRVFEEVRENDDDEVLEILTIMLSSGVLE